ncbi:hypothetical protein [Pseudonocardia pini]|uniref:hypothetical protein n=1 Tax=Pseudonocardia pini TaxID=2758030 RepID=UPI0015F0A490|nr:hypothetical protein [Pseudonocardia pini]
MIPPFGRQHRPVLAATSEYQFSFTRLTRPVLAVLGVGPGTSWVRVEHDRLDVRFGPWRVQTLLTNIASVETSGPFGLVKALGPRLSLADRGLTFGSDTDGGVCLRFIRPVTGLVPFGLLHHPGLTVTVSTPQLLISRVGRSLEAQTEISSDPEGSTSA